MSKDAPGRPDDAGRSGHHHYAHYSPAMAARLDGFFGRVDERLNARIAACVTGESVLDVGCGFGSLTEHLRLRGLRATGVDLLAECIAAGRARYPHADLRLAESEELAFPDASFDTVVLKDTIHHVYEEDDVAAFLRAVRRIARRRLVILDPNPTTILLLARRIIGHVDPVCGPADARARGARGGLRPAAGAVLGALRLSAQRRLRGSAAGARPRPRAVGSVLLAAGRGAVRGARRRRPGTAHGLAVPARGRRRLSAAGGRRAAA